MVLYTFLQYIYKVWVGADMAYNTTRPPTRVGKYLWYNLQDHKVIKIQGERIPQSPHHIYQNFQSPVGTKGTQGWCQCIRSKVNEYEPFYPDMPRNLKYLNKLWTPSNNSGEMIRITTHS